MKQHACPVFQEERQQFALRSSRLVLSVAAAEWDEAEKTFGHYMQWEHESH